MAQYDSGAASLVKKSHNLVAHSLELSVNKTTILEGKTQDNFLEIILLFLLSRPIQWDQK